MNRVPSFTIVGHKPPLENSAAAFVWALPRFALLERVFVALPRFALLEPVFVALPRFALLERMRFAPRVR